MWLLRFPEHMETRITRNPRSMSMSRSEVAVILFRLDELTRLLATITESVNELSARVGPDRSRP
jgi:hypothetical protein